MGIQLPLPKGAQAPQFLDHICCDQMAGWIKTPLGTEVGQFSVHIYCGQTTAWNKMALGMGVGLRPGHMLLDGTPLRPPKRGRAPNFRPMSIVAKRLYVSGCHLVLR